MGRKTNGVRLPSDNLQALSEMAGQCPEYGEIYHRDMDTIRQSYAFGVEMAFRNLMSKTEYGFTIQVIVKHTRYPRPRVEKIVKLWEARGLLTVETEPPRGQGRPANTYYPVPKYWGIQDDDTD